MYYLPLHVLISIGYNDLRATRQSEAHNDGASAKADQPDFGKKLKDFPKACFLLVCQKGFLFVGANHVT